MKILYKGHLFFLTIFFFKGSVNSFENLSNWNSFCDSPTFTQTKNNTLIR